MLNLGPICLIAALFHQVGIASAQATTEPPSPAGPQLEISGIYPHLAMFGGGGESGIGAVVPWAGKLWAITYPPHEIHGSKDKLYEIDEQMNVRIRPESVGGTHACRMIHRESEQLIIGPYFVSKSGMVRAVDLHKLAGRLTAVARHLTEPANKVYFVAMEGSIYEVDVHSLAVTRLFEKPVPGWHGKGGYTGQGRLVISNNGEVAVGATPRHYLADWPFASPENAGVLAEYDGSRWKIIERRQFTDITGPGGIYGSPSDTSPLWAIGWDRRSVKLKLLDGGRWSTFRLPKASHAFDPRNGWYTEWPRIREAAAGRLMMDMHAMFYDFPASFSAADTGGIRAISSHLRYIPDFCNWNGRLVLGADDATMMQNAMVGQSQSNLWFGHMSDLPTFGPAAGWGGSWLRDSVQPGQPSDPFLLAGLHGFDERVVHLTHDSDTAVHFTMELDQAGDGHWSRYKTISVEPKGYQFEILPRDLAAEWIRFTVDKACTATAYLHQTKFRDASQDKPNLFASLPKAGSHAAMTLGLVRPAAHNRNLQFVALTLDAAGNYSPAHEYYEVDEHLKFFKPAAEKAAARKTEVVKIANTGMGFNCDDASAIFEQDGNRYRLPKGNVAYDDPLAFRPRSIREAVSERYIVNVHGTFYEMPRHDNAQGAPKNRLPDGLPMIKPICSHNRKVYDFCTWRGLFVISGNLADAGPDGHFFASPDGKAGLWFGHIDDLWRLGKPVGHGGPWLKTKVEADERSDPYLMTGFDKKRIELSHNLSVTVRFTVEVDFDHYEWVVFKTFDVHAGQTVHYTIPPGFSAHWIRAYVDRDCEATMQLLYE
jgi:hypothetical protein